MTYSMDPDVETNRFIFFQKYPAGWLDKNIEFLTNDIIILFEYCTHKCRFAKSSSLCNSLRIFFSYLIGFFERMKAPMPEHVCVCQHFNYDSPLMFVFPSLHKCIMTLPSHLHMFSLLLCHYDNILLSYPLFFSTLIPVFHYSRYI